MRFVQLANHFGPRLRHTIVALDGNVSAQERLAVDVGFEAVAQRRGDTLGSVRQARAVLRRLRPDALFTYNWGAIEWAMANMLPLARHVHVEDGFGPEERQRQILRRVWTRRLVLRRRTVVLPSQTLVRIATEAWRLDPRWIRFIPNGVDLARFPPRTPGGGPCVVGTVAGLRAEKNVGRLVRAFAAVPPPARLVVVGDGPDRAGLEATAAALGLADRATFTGALADPAPLYQTFDVFALSSDTEQQPLSLLEAMASGCAVVATDVGDVRAMLSAANQAWVTAVDDAAFTAGLTQAAADARAQVELGQANRSTAVMRYDQQAMFDAWSDVFGIGRP